MQNAINTNVNTFVPVADLTATRTPTPSGNVRSAIEYIGEVHTDAYKEAGMRMLARRVLDDHPGTSVAVMASVLMATNAAPAISGTTNETLVATAFARAVLDYFNLRDTVEGAPLQHWLSHMAVNGPAGQTSAIQGYIGSVFTPDSARRRLDDLLQGIESGPAIRTVFIEQASPGFPPGMADITANIPVVVCPHCGRLTPLHTAMRNPHEYIVGAYHCPHCLHMAWWRAFDPSDGSLAERVEICTAILSDAPTPMNRLNLFLALRGKRVDSRCVPFMYVDTDSVLADTAHPWHMHLFPLSTIEFERKHDIDKALFGCCARCARPVPSREVTVDGVIDTTNDSNEGWVAQISSSQGDLCDITYRTTYDFEDIIICDDCVESDNLGCCDHCGTYTSYDNLVAVRGSRGVESYVCDDCAEANYYRCTDCGDWFTESAICRDYAGDWYCEACYEEHEDDRYEEEYDDDNDSHHRIHEYSYKPTPKKHGNGIWDSASQTGGNARFAGYGLELEHSSHNNKYAMAEMFCRSICDDEDYFYMKEDSSVSQGIEFVSHPVSLAAWQDQYSKAQACLRAICRIAEEYSYDREDDGFHIHVSRTAFYSPVDDKPGKQSWNVKHRLCFDAFFNRVVKHTPAEAVIGRCETHWGAGQIVGRTVGAAATRFTRHEPYERYRAVNWNNRNTAEVRVFHSTDSLDAILACIEMVDAAINFTHPRRGGATQSQIVGKYPTAKLWDSFCEWVVLRESQYPHLAAALVD